MNDSIEDLSETLISTYDHLSSLLRIPLIERELYEVLFVNELRQRIRGKGGIECCDSTDTPAKEQIEIDAFLGALRIIVAALKEHHRRTVAVLRCISRREELISQVIDLCEQYESGGCALDQAQVAFLLILQEHQDATLNVVEAISEWRQQLSRPYPFCVFNSTVNYLERVLEDCEAISWCPLGRSLRLRLDAFPCGSCMNFSRMLRSHRIMWRARILNTGSIFQEGAMGFMQGNLNSQTASYRQFPRQELRSKPQHHMSQSEELNATKIQQHLETVQTGISEASLKEKNSRLIVAEDQILKEATVQQHLAEELYELADAANPDRSRRSGKFLLTLSLPELFSPADRFDEFSVPFAFSLNKEHWKDILPQVLDQEHCVEVAIQTYEMLKRQKLCLLDTSSKRETTGNAFTPHDSMTPSTSSILSASESSRSISVALSSSQSLSMDLDRKPHSVVVKSLTEELLRQGLAPQMGNGDHNMVRHKNVVASGTLTNTSKGSVD